MGRWSVMLYDAVCRFVLCPRCAINVTQSSRTMTPNITAVPAGRASAMAALPNLRRSPREAGVLALSECVTSASSRGPRTQVRTFSNVKCHNAWLLSSNPILTFGKTCSRKDIFLCRATEGRSGRRRRWNPRQEGWRSSHQHHRGCSHCYWHPTWWVLPKTKPFNEPYVMEKHEQ